MELREPPALPTKKAVMKQLKKKDLTSKSFHDVFAMNDIDHSGSLTEAAVARLLDTHGIKNASGDYIHKLFEIFDCDGSGDISEEEFVCLWKMLNLHADETRGEVEPTAANVAGFDRSLIDDALTSADPDDVEAGEAERAGLFAAGAREAERVEIDAKFKKYDEDHAGTLSRAKVENAFATEGLPIVSSEVRLSAFLFCCLPLPLVGSKFRLYLSLIKKYDSRLTNRCPVLTWSNQSQLLDCPCPFRLDSDASLCRIGRFLTRCGGRSTRTRAEISIGRSLRRCTR